MLRIAARYESQEERHALAAHGNHSLKISVNAMAEFEAKMFGATPQTR
jgi:hypothetical protein